MESDTFLYEGQGKSQQVWNDAGVLGHYKTWRFE